MEEKHHASSLRPLNEKIHQLREQARNATGRESLQFVHQIEQLQKERQVQLHRWIVSSL